MWGRMRHHYRSPYSIGSRYYYSVPRHIPATEVDESSSTNTTTTTTALVVGGAVAVVVIGLGAIAYFATKK
jgi:hypothetical protein